jgi:hypothetical protein
MMLDAPWELLDGFVMGLSGMWSFDCVSLRFAQGNSAQDDRTLTD